MRLAVIMLITFGTLMVDPEERVVLVLDLVDSVSLMATSEARVVELWQAYVVAASSEVLPATRGRMVKSLGDGLLVEFASSLDAVRSAWMLRELLNRLCHSKPIENPRLELRMGIHRAAVYSDANDLYGAGVNLAARLASVAQPGDIVVSNDVRDDLLEGLDAEIEDLGDVFVKGLQDPVRTYRITPVCGHVSRRERPVIEPLQPTVAVLYFDPIQIPETHQVLGELLAENVIGLLSRCRDIRVISRLSVRRIKGRSVELADLRRDLGAHYVVSGTYRLTSDRVRIGIELARTRDGVVVASETFVSPWAALLSDNPDIGQQLATLVLSGVVRSETERSLARPLPSLESCTLLVAAISNMHRLSRQPFARSFEMLSHLCERHPRHPEPYAWLAKWYALRVSQGWSASNTDDVSNAYRCASIALQLAPDLPIALTMAGLVYTYLKRDLSEAAEAYDLALTYSPNDSMARLLRGTLHAFLAEGSQALSLTTSALQLSPLDPLLYYYQSLSASAAIAAGEYSKAVEYAQSSIRLNREHASTFRSLAIALSLDGRLDEARDVVQRIIRLEPGFTVSKFRERYPAATAVPNYVEKLAQSLFQAGLPA